MKNTITILTLFFSLLAVHAEATPVQLQRDCNKSSRVTRGIITSITEPTNNPDYDDRLIYNIHIDLLSDYARYQEELQYSSFLYLFHYDSVSSTSIATYTLLKKSHTYVTPVVVTECNGRSFNYYAQEENILLPDMLITKESSQIVSAEHSQRNSPLDIELGYDPETAWHWGRVLDVIRYRSDKPVCIAVVKGTENIDDDILPERFVYEVKSNGLCSQLERAVFSPSPVEFQLEGGCIPDMRLIDSWRKDEELLRCRRTLSALRGVET